MITNLSTKEIGSKVPAELKSNGGLYLTRERIVDLLPFFKEECVYMREAYFEGEALHCSFNTFDYPFSKKLVMHMTRTHALLFVTQACYLMVTIFGEHNPRWPLDRETAMSLAMQEQMAFTSIGLRFKKYIGNEDGIELSLLKPTFRIFRNRIFTEIEFEFPAGCFGQCKGIIALDGSLNAEM